MEALKRLYLLPYRCHLCQFELSEDEQCVTITENGGISEIFEYDRITARGGDIMCHSGCVKLVVHNPYNVSLATSYAYEPSMREARRRETWLHSNLASDLILSRHHYIPPELRQMIAQPLLREYAVLKAASYLHKLRRPRDICVDLLTKVWACYTEFEGITYISDLTNRPGDGYEVIFVPDLAQRIDCMYMSEDHLGVRQIRFSSCGQVPPATPSLGVWWSTLQTASSNLKVLGKTDGIKLRDVGWAEPVPELAPVSTCTWEIPTPPTTQIRFDIMGDSSHDLSCGLVAPLCVTDKARPRMALLRCNDLDITGYSMFWNERLMYIHAHRKGESLSFYDHPTRSNGFWLYMPLRDGEFLEDIWTRRHPLPPGNGLVFRTNKGQIMTAGPYLHPGWSEYSWGHLQTLENAPSRLFFEYSAEGIFSLGVETSPPISLKNPVGLRPFSPLPKSLSLRSYFFSRASLEDVVEVKPCCMETAGISAIIGLLLRYGDGHQWSVGEIRLDLLQDGIRMDQSEKMTLGFAAPGGYPYVASIQHSNVDRGQSDSSQLVLLDIHWTGYLEWWFSRQQCKVYHNGQASPETNH
ncbi:hypothetical protein F4818DRAFT_430286 [Hypoxylon cercidicola]|nr:hypothetical protein F4818DRAFT_430286 [Hypoxylon cercidicola]